MLFLRFWKYLYKYCKYNIPSIMKAFGALGGSEIVIPFGFAERSRLHAPMKEGSETKRNQIWFLISVVFSCLGKTLKSVYCVLVPMIAGDSLPRSE